MTGYSSGDQTLVNLIKDIVASTLRGVTLEFRQDTAATWSAKNPILKMGEPAFEKDTGIFKVGDGQTSYSSLSPYVTLDLVTQMVNDSLAEVGGGSLTLADLQAHIDAVDPHPSYDDGTSFLLRYENAKV